MKKILVLALAAACVAPLFANDEEEESIDTIFEPTVEVERPRKQAGVWPGYFAFCNMPPAANTPDVIGLRVTIPFSTEHESVTGIDFGLWGESLYFEGFMCSLLRNKVNDQFVGLQLGIYNTANQADVPSLQVGLWNEAGSLRGMQVGLINSVGIGQGFQFGLINRAEEFYGFQVGAINVIRDAEVQFLPLVNIGW